MTVNHLEKRSLTLHGHATSVALEPAFWSAAERTAHARGQSVTELIAEIDGARTAGPLASAVRVYLLREATTK